MRSVKMLFVGLSLVLASVAHAEYLGLFEATGADDISVYKENDKLIMRSEVVPSRTDVYFILPNEDDYLFGSNGKQSKTNGIVVEVLGMSGAYNGLLKTTYANGKAVSSVLYLLVEDRCRTNDFRRSWHTGR